LYKKITLLLMSSGAQVNVSDSDGITPLHMAVDQAQKDLIELLIQKGADVNARSNDGFTPLRMVKRSEILRYEVKLAREITDILKRAGSHE